MNRDEVLRKLQEIAQELGKKTLTQKDIRESRLISGYWIRKHFPDLASALEAAELQPSKLAKAMSTSDDELLDYLTDLRRRLGRQPTNADVDRDGRFSQGIFRTRFGSLGKALWQLGERERRRQFEAGTDELGAAAEYIVVGELLYRGFNANLLPVDRGIDVVALKGEKTFSIQVKNVSMEKAESGRVSITASAYERHRASGVYYIFVLNREQDRRFLILPYHKMEDLIDSGVVPVRDRRAKKYSFDVLWSGEHVYVNEETEMADITSHLNAWEKIV